jgi:hypothetical protein
MRHSLRPKSFDSTSDRFGGYKVYYDILGWVLTQMVFPFAVAPIVLEFGFLQAWASVYYYGLAAIVCWYFVKVTIIKISKNNSRLLLW